VSPLRIWKRAKELVGILPSAVGGPDADLIPPRATCPQLGGIVPFGMHLAARGLAFWLPAALAHRRLALYWYRWRLLWVGDWDRPGVHFDPAGRLIETPVGPVDDPPAALVI
jgi:hypothetical protein